jgi:hypothetical protein
MQKETKFYKELKPMLESVPKSVWFKIQAGSIRGRSDIMGCVNGKFIALELKKDSKESQNKGRAKLQAVKQNQIREAGGFASFVTPDNFGDILEALFNIAEL